MTDPTPVYRTYVREDGTVVVQPTAFATPMTQEEWARRCRRAEEEGTAWWAIPPQGERDADTP